MKKLPIQFQNNVHALDINDLTFDHLGNLYQKENI